MSYESAKKRILKEIFGHEDFREGQEKIVNCLALEKRDVLCVMPTGGGKSLCYQLPALLSEGITLVISPLISLMKDQVAALREADVRAAYLNGSLTEEQYFKALYNAGRGMYKIIYVAPERLESASFASAAKEMNISLIAVDEAHCVSQWGQDFRPGYLKIADFIKSLPNRPVVGAFTATATERVKQDIIRLLELNSPYCMTSGFDRPNLRFAVYHPEKRGKLRFLMQLLDSRRSRSGIVYCLTRKDVENVCEELRAEGYAATRYHAGLDSEERKRNQEDFDFDRALIMVATNAFGMGIDKSNVTYVIHYSMPMDIESYYQEAGRAGRDGSPSDCILLCSPGDISVNRYMLEHGEPNPLLSEKQQQDVRRLSLSRLYEMYHYCTDGGCLRRRLLGYFGESAPDFCGNCSECSAGAEDITVAAQMILSCIIRCGQELDGNGIADVLLGRGKKLTDDMLEKYASLPLFGVAGRENINRAYITAVTGILEKKGLIRPRGGEDGIYTVGDDYVPVLRGEKKLVVRKEGIPEKYRKKPDGSGRKAAAERKKENERLFAVLCMLRREIVMRKDIPAYLIFTDSTLREMSEKHPLTEKDFLQISGVGQKKAETLGPVFMKCISDFLSGKTFTQKDYADLAKKT